MTKILTKSRRYRMSKELFLKLEKLKEINICESRFVREAIEEKFQKEYPKLKINQVKTGCPF